MKTVTEGCVYFFKHKNIEGIKIGYSLDLSPIKRFNQFKIYAPFGALMLGFIESYDAKKLETKLHKKYSDKRMEGEWFNISINEVNDIIDFYSTENNIELRSILWQKYSEDLDYRNKEGENISEQFDIFMQKIIENKKGYIKRTELRKKYNTFFEKNLTPQELYKKIRSYLNFNKIKYFEKKYNGSVVFDFRGS